MDQISVWKQDILLFSLSVPWSDHVYDLPVGYDIMLIARYYLSVEEGISPHPPEKFLANVCFIISVLPVLKLTFKYLGEISGTGW